MVSGLARNILVVSWLVVWLEIYLSTQHIEVREKTLTRNQDKGSCGVTCLPVLLQ